MRRFLFWLTRRMSNPRVIYDRMGVSPYLSRWYIFGKPVMPDGSNPFESDGRPRRQAVFRTRWGLYLHRFHRSDEALEIHNHPWLWSLSFVLVGGYSEERMGSKGLVIRRNIRPFRFNFIRHGTFHRVDLLEQDAWTLFLVGPKTHEWGFLDRKTKIFKPWREYIDDLRRKDDN